MQVKIKKTFLVIVIALFILLIPFGYFWYKDYTRLYLPFFMNANIYSSNFGTEKQVWGSYDFQPITQSIIENSDGVILNVKYKNSNNKWLNAKVLLWGKDKYQDIKNVNVFNSLLSVFQPYKEADVKIDSLDKAKKMIQMDQQVLITVYQRYPNPSERTEENCKSVQDATGMNLCIISNVIDQNSPTQLSFWDKEDMNGQYIIPNFIVLTPINEQ